jgi:hypothetical protein
VVLEEADERASMVPPKRACEGLFAEMRGGEKLVEMEGKLGWRPINEWPAEHARARSLTKDGDECSQLPSSTPSSSSVVTDASGERLVQGANEGCKLKPPVGTLAVSSSEEGSDEREGVGDGDGEALRLGEAGRHDEAQLRYAEGASRGGGERRRE